MTTREPNARRISSEGIAPTDKKRSRSSFTSSRQAQDSALEQGFYRHSERRTLLEWDLMTPRSGEELIELEARQEPRLVKALEMVAPGSAVREGIDNIVHARTGGLIVIGDPDELSDRSSKRGRSQDL